MGLVRFREYTSNAKRYDHSYPSLANEISTSHTMTDRAAGHSPFLSQTNDSASSAYPFL